MGINIDEVIDDIRNRVDIEHNLSRLRQHIKDLEYKLSYLEWPEIS